MKSNGSLAEHDIPSLVQDFYEERRTGVLTLTHAAIGRSVGAFAWDLWAFRVIGLIRRTDNAAEPATDAEDESLGIIVPEE